MCLERGLAFRFLAGHVPADAVLRLTVAFRLFERRVDSPPRANGHSVKAAVLLDDEILGETHSVGPKASKLVPLQFRCVRHISHFNVPGFICSQDS